MLLKRWERGKVRQECNKGKKDTSEKKLSTDDTLKEDTGYYMEYTIGRIQVGIISVGEFKERKDELGYHLSTLVECENPKGRFRNDVEVYDDYSFAMLSIIDSKNIHGFRDRIGFFMKEDTFYVVDCFDEDGSTGLIFHETVHYFEKIGKVTLERFIYHMLMQLLNDDITILEQYEFDINEMEESVVEGSVNKNFNAELMSKKKELLVLRNFYEQLIDLGQDLQENENGIFHESALRYFRIFTDKVVRLCDNVNMLKENLVQVREAYQASLDYNLNRIMKVFTVVTTIFLPLTLIVGWYGMNFVGMPELHWRYGYAAVILLSIAVIVICIYFFKKKKFL